MQKRLPRAILFALGVVTLLSGCSDGPLSVVDVLSRADELTGERVKVEGWVAYVPDGVSETIHDGIVLTPRACLPRDDDKGSPECANILKSIDGIPAITVSDLYESDIRMGDHVVVSGIVNNVGTKDVALVGLEHATLEDIR